MKKAVFYARVSTTEEGQLMALENQVDLLRKTINDNDEWILTKEYIDTETGTSDKRNSYNELLEDIRDEKFEILVVKDMSRLNRNVFHYYVFLDTAVHSGIKIWVVADNKFFEYKNTIENGVKALLAAEYSHDISKKVKIGVTNKQRAGTFICTNNMMWGYRQEKGSKELVIDEDEAKVVRMIFSLYDSGMGLKKIFKYLNNEGYRNKNGTLFNNSTVRNIIRNEKYKGWLINNKTTRDFITKKIIKNPQSEWIIHKGAIPAIVDEDLWDRCNARLNINSEASKGIDNRGMYGEYAYSGILRCGKCGRSFWHIKRKGGKRQNYWYCQEYKKYGRKREGNEHGCWGIKFTTEELNEAVNTVLKELIDNKEEAINKVIGALEQALEEEKKDNNLEQLKKDLLAAQNKLDKLLDLYLESDMGAATKKAYDKKREALENKIDSLESSIKKLENNTDNPMEKRIERLKTFRDTLEAKFNADSEDFIKTYVDKIIVVGEQELDIYLRDYMLTENDNNGGENEIVQHFQLGVNTVRHLHPTAKIRACYLQG